MFYAKEKFGITKMQISSLLNNLIKEYDQSKLIHNPGNINNATNSFMNKYIAITRKCLPEKNVTIGPNDKPLMDSLLRKTTFIQNRLRLRVRYLAVIQIGVFKQCLNNINVIELNLNYDIHLLKEGQNNGFYNFIHTKQKQYLLVLKIQNNFLICFLIIVLLNMFYNTSIYISMSTIHFQLNIFLFK